MMDRFSKLVVIFIIFGCAINSWGDDDEGPCKDLNFTLQGGVNLNTDSAPQLQLSVSRKAEGNDRNKSCDFFLVINNGSASSYINRVLTKTSPTSTYPIQFYKEAGFTNIVMSISEATATNIISGKFVNGNSPINLYYYPKFDPNLIKPVGNYVGTFSVSLYQGTFSNHSSQPVVNPKPVTFTFNVGKFVDISLVDTSAPFVTGDRNQSLDFGTLSTGATLGFDTVLMYNSGYTLKMSSLNNGKLKNQNPLITTFNLIPYTMTLNGSAPFSLTTSLVTKSVSSITVSPPQGTRLPTTVIIGDLTTAQPKPGNYSDTVTISVSAN